MPSKIDLTSDQVNNIVNLYLDGYSTVKISHYFNCRYNFIRKILKQQNISIRAKDECGRKLPINKHYFDNIDCEDKAYYLGFIFSDGCNYTNNGNYQITLTLNKRDIDIVTKYSTLIYEKEQITTSKDTVTCAIYSKHMSQVLESYGCTARKSLTLKFPTCVPDHLLHHFMRGYFDGDGCIYLGKQNNKIDGRVNIVSTMDFCKQYKEILWDKAGIKAYIHQDKRDLLRGNTITSILMVNGNKQVNKLYNFLYADANYYLERKREKFLKINQQLQTSTNLFL